MFDAGTAVIAAYRRRLEELRKRAAMVTDQLDDDDVNWRPNDESNSIANLVLHLAGNLYQNCALISGEPDTRDRNAEFNFAGRMGRDEVMARLNDAIARTDALLATLPAERLAETRPRRDRSETVLNVLLMAITHLSEHVGQISYIAKVRLGAGYRVVTIPHKKA